VSNCRVTVLISGSGSNLQALIEARDQGKLEVELVHVISNRGDALGLQRAAKAGIESSVLPHQAFDSRGQFDQALAALIESHHPELVILAGFMRILGPTVIDRMQNRMINLHPSLLPLYRGTDTYRRAIEAGDREHGASMHFVTGELDGGPLISQVRVAVQENDTVATLAARLAPREHDLIVATSRLFCQHSIRCSNNQVYFGDAVLQQPLQLQPDGSFFE
jgi:phosphoribosylglycinamide formyltransferase-1